MRKDGGRGDGRDGGRGDGRDSGRGDGGGSVHLQFNAHNFLISSLSHILTLPYLTPSHSPTPHSHR